VLSINKNAGKEFRAEFLSGAFGEGCSVQNWEGVQKKIGFSKIT